MALTDATIRLSDITAFLFLYLSLASFFPPKRPGGARHACMTALGVAVGMLGILALEAISGGSYWLYLLNFLWTGFAFSLLFLSGPWLSKLLLCVVFCSLFNQLFVVELFASRFLGGIYAPNRPLFTQLLIFGFLRLTRRRTGKGRWELPLGYWWIIVACSAVCLGFAFSLSGAPMFEGLAFPLRMAVLAINLAVFYFCARMSYEARANEELRLVNGRLQLYRQQMEGMEEAYQQARKLRHDMDNHILVISALAKSRAYGDLDKYLGELTQGRAGGQEGGAGSGNRVVDAILGQKLAQARGKGIPMTVSAQAPEGLPLLDVDLAALLFNLLDNTLEASEKARDPKVDLKIYVKKGYLCIQASNRVDGDPLAENPRMETTKEDKGGHGVGARIIRSLVGKYDGILQYECAGGMLTAYVMLCIAEGAANGEMPCTANGDMPCAAYEQAAASAPAPAGAPAPSDGAPGDTQAGPR